ncbi:MAG: DUF4870 domain-containing protein [Coriobacteriia bacterium]|nr:DUF4870 domain-containing protein [Coriobacteriia bacterium]
MAPVGGGYGPASDTSKILAAVGYLTGIVALIAILIEPYKDEKFIRHHAIQALGLAIVLIAANVVLGVLSAVPVIQVLAVIGWALVYPAWLVLAIIGAVKAWNGEMWEMPVVYGIVKQYI